MNNKTKEKSREEIVLSRLKKLGKNSLLFYVCRSAYYDLSSKKYQETLLETRVTELKKLVTIDDRIKKIISISQSFGTCHESGRYQCIQGARRSTIDIWRIYKYYFGDTSLFEVMNSLYRLVVEQRKFNTYICPDIRKRVYWTKSYSWDNVSEIDTKGELGVPMHEWKGIGENLEEEVKNKIE